MAVDPFQLSFAMVLSFILIVIIVACANYIYYFGRQRALQRAASQPFRLEDIIVPPKHFILLRVLLDKNEHASLSTFQFLAWTLVISFLYVTLWFLWLFNDSIMALTTISPSLMALMGISVAMPIASQGIAAYKRLKPRQVGETYLEPDYASMLEENGRPSLLRLQMFLWTLAAIAIFFGVFFTSAFSPDTTPLTLGLPEIDPTLLFLMGLSATGYLGNQAYSGKVEKAEKPATLLQPALPAETVSGTAPVRLPPAIREIIPRDVEPKGIVTLLGSGFGVRQDTIMIGEDRVPSSAIRRWEDTRIEFTLPETASPGSHNLRIISGGESVKGQISVSGPVWTRGLNEIDADILGDIWIDDPSQKGYRLPPIGHFIPDKRYYFFFEFDVPPGTPPWGRIQFRAKFFLDGVLVATRSFLPGTLNGQNYGNFDYVFTAEGKHHIEIMGSNSKSMDIEVKKPRGQ
jgi:hypothetical protein